MWESFKKSGMDKTTAINDIDCRTDMCIVDIAQSSSEEEDTAVQGQDVFSWVSANAGICEFVISGGSAGEDPEAITVQRVYLTNCRQSLPQG